MRAFANHQMWTWSKIVRAFSMDIDTIYLCKHVYFRYTSGAPAAWLEWVGAGLRDVAGKDMWDCTNNSGVLTVARHVPW